MPRFTTRTMLIACGIAALWFATFNRSPFGADIRRSMLLLVLVVATSLALFRQGKRRVFWAGFSIVMFLCGGLEMSQPLNRYVPAFAWQGMLGASASMTYVPPTPSLVYVPPRQAPSNPASPTYYSYGPTPAVVLPSLASYALGETMAALWTFGLAALSGFLAAYIYSRQPAPRTATSPTARRIVEEELGRDVVQP